MMSKYGIPAEQLVFKAMVFLPPQIFFRPIFEPYDSFDVLCSDPLAALLFNEASEQPLFCISGEQKEQI